MGVYYSVSVGYGFVMEDGELLESLELEDPEEVNDWLVENGYAVEAAYAGNQMCGPTYIFFHDPHTYYHEETNLFDGVHEVVPPGGGFVEELCVLALALGYTGHIGAIVIGNVS